MPSVQCHQLLGLFIFTSLAHCYLPYESDAHHSHHHHQSFDHHHYHPQPPRDVLVDVVNNLGVTLLAIHNENNENNIALSPYGALSVLVALGEGVRGEAVHEIQHAAHIPHDVSLIRVGLRDIHRHLKSYFVPKEGFLAGLTLNHENVTLNPEYEEILKFYGFDLESFNNALYPEPLTTEKSTSTEISSTEIFEPLGKGEETPITTEITTEGTTLTTTSDEETTISTTTEAKESSTEMSSDREARTTFITSTTSPETTTEMATSTTESERETTTLVSPTVRTTESSTNAAETTTSVPTTAKTTESTTNEAETTTTIEQLSTLANSESTTTVIVETTEGTTVSGTSEASTSASTTESLTTVPPTTIITTTVPSTTVPTTTILPTTIPPTAIPPTTVLTELETTLPQQETFLTTVLPEPPTNPDQPISPNYDYPFYPDPNQTNPPTNAYQDFGQPQLENNEVVPPLQQKRNVRSVYDYVIAQYYDDHYHHHRQPPTPHYIPDELSFLVYGRYREPKITFNTYDTILPFLYVQHLNALALRFPLDSERYYLLLLLPIQADGIDDLICNLRLNGDLKYIIDNLQNTHVIASLPSFMLKGYVNLTPTLQKLGVRQVFEPRQADFSPMTRDKEIYVTNVEQAVTVNIRNYVDPGKLTVFRNLQQYRPVRFKADHPFLYFVLDSDLHVTLMAGKIVNPLNSRIR